MLTAEELSKKKITLSDIKEGKAKARDFFIQILEESDIIEDFSADSSQLFIEVSISNDNIFMITVTKADCIPDTSTLDKMKRIENVCYTVSSNIYEFEDIKDLYSFASKALIEGLYLGNNSLYEINGIYILYFSNASIKNSSFVKTFSILSEYSSKYYYKNLISFLEYANVLRKNNAIQYLQNL